MTGPVIIRNAMRDDLPAITDIYNEAIVNTVATFDTEPKTAQDQLEWFEQRGGQHPIMVAVMNDQVVGWVCLSEWCNRHAYNDTVELAVYVHKEHRGKGIGSKLVSAVLGEAKRIGLHVIVARIESTNHIVIHLLGQYGFERIGLMREVGKKFGRRLDVVMMQLII